jgi:hypothetical protein
LGWVQKISTVFNFCLLLQVALIDRVVFVCSWSVAADVAAIWQLRDFVCLFAVELQLHTT